MKPTVFILPAIFAFLTSCGTVRKVNSGVKWSYDKTAGAVSGATKLVGGAAMKLWPWGKKDEAPPVVASAKPPTPPAPAPAAPAVAAGNIPPPPTPGAPPPAASAPPAEVPPASTAAAADKAKSAEPAFQFPKTKLWVTDAVLGADRREDTDATLKLKEGWMVSASRLLYISDYAGDPPSLLRAEGSPCRATTESSGKAIAAQGREMHYRQDTGVLTLKGFPAVQIGKKKVAAASGATVIMVHLESGALESQGPITVTGE